ncbi:MAG TPA: helix-turn-helix transcriptional regulator [Candidatus Omnitrophota bacterium]|nr:helix-turn-helix transcriptional regulator [Candidatus Omnitrophota bacterium]
MLAVVKKSHTKEKIFEIRGAIPPDVVRFLETKYGQDLSVIEDDETYVDITQTPWYKKTRSRMTPGRTLKVYRERDHLTQEELGKRLGGLSIQKVSDLEHGRRGISKDLAKKLAVVFGTSTDKFL